MRRRLATTDPEPPASPEIPARLKTGIRDKRARRKMDSRLADELRAKLAKQSSQVQNIEAKAMAYLTPKMGKKFSKMVIRSVSALVMMAICFVAIRRGHLAFALVILGLQVRGPSAQRVLRACCCAAARVLGRSSGAVWPTA